MSKTSVARRNSKRRQAQEIDYIRQEPRLSKRRAKVKVKVQAISNSQLTVSYRAMAKQNGIPRDQLPSHTMLGKDAIDVTSRMHRLWDSQELHPYGMGRKDAGKYIRPAMPKYLGHKPMLGFSK